MSEWLRQRRINSGETFVPALADNSNRIIVARRNPGCRAVGCPSGRPPTPSALADCDWLAARGLAGQSGKGATRAPALADNSLELSLQGAVPVHGGGVTEWPNVLAWKASVRETVPRVRISPPPPCIGRKRVYRKVSRVRIPLPPLCTGEKRVCRKVPRVRIPSSPPWIGAMGCPSPACLPAGRLKLRILLIPVRIVPRP